MKKKILITILLLTFTLPLFSIGFGYHVLEMRSEPEFAKGVFPSSVKYQFNFPVPDFVNGNITELTFRLDNGLVYRSLNQDPKSGKHYEQYPDLLTQAGFSLNQARDYSVQFDEFSLHFSQGFFKTPLSDKDLLRFEFSFGGRFENAFERLFFMYNENNTSGVFFKSFGEERFSDNIFNAYPELKNDGSNLRSFFSTFINFNFDINLLKDEVTRKSGVKLSVDYRLSPKTLLMNDGTADFSKLSLSIEGAHTIGSCNYKNRPELSWLSSTMGFNFTYRYIEGTSVPSYVMQDKIFGLTIPNTQHIAYGRIYLTIFGPQLGAKDLYPFITVFNDAAISYGSVINSTVGESLKQVMMSFGVKAEFVLYSIANIYYEIGYVYNGVFDQKPHKVQAKFGLTVGV